MTDFDAWKSRALESDILSEAQKRGAVLKRAGREYIGPCPACGGRDRFSINPQKQIFNCRGFGGGDVIALVMHLDGVSFTQACEALTGEPPPRGKSKPLTPEQKAEWARKKAVAEQEQRRREQAEAAYQQDTREAALEIWNECRQIVGTAAERYLHGRGMPTPPTGWPDCLAFHPSLPYPDMGRHPALVCRVDDVAGDLTAVWRIFLTDDGRKADVPNVKLGLGPASGGAVRIGGPALGTSVPKVGIAEGVESALGAWNLIGRRYPVWAALSTSGVIAVELPFGVTETSVFPDGDIPIKRDGASGEYVPSGNPPGRRAARALRDRLIAEGIKCTVACEPPPRFDYADLWQAHVKEAA